MSDLAARLSDSPRGTVVRWEAPHHGFEAAILDGQWYSTVFREDVGSHELAEFILDSRKADQAVEIIYPEADALRARDAEYGIIRDSSYPNIIIHINPDPPGDVGDYIFLTDEATGYHASAGRDGYFSSGPLHGLFKEVADRYFKDVSPTPPKTPKEIVRGVLGKYEHTRDPIHGVYADKIVEALNEAGYLKDEK